MVCCGHITNMQLNSCAAAAGRERETAKLYTEAWNDCDRGEP